MLILESFCSDILDILFLGLKTITIIIIIILLLIMMITVQCKLD